MAKKQATQTRYCKQCGEEFNPRDTVDGEHCQECLDEMSDEWMSQYDGSQSVLD